MKMRIKLNNTGFTLTEVIVAAVIFSIVSVGSIISISSLVKAGEITRNRTISSNLIQQSQEEVKRISQTFFDQLESCQFPSSITDGNQINLCGFSNISLTYPEFKRSLTVIQEEGSNGLKRALITVSWNEFDRMRLQQSIVLLSRPPEALPGNIIGFVSSADNPSQPIAGANISIIPIDNIGLNSTNSAALIDPQTNSNFDFADPASGRFLLKTGSYVLSATHEDYLPYTYPDNPVVVQSNQETFVNILLILKPKDARIYGSVIDRNTNQVVNDFNKSNVNLFERGNFIQSVSNRNYSFSISFDQSAGPKCFTVNSTDVFKAGYAGYPSCSFTYDREGWSTATTNENNALTCSNPRNGSAASDRICVSPGEELLLNLPVVPVPEIMVTGRVIDNRGNLVPNATIQARWPKSDQSEWRKNGGEVTAATQPNGRFNYSVPAVQGLFPQNNPNQNYLQLMASANFNIQNCCNQMTTVNRNSSWIVINNPLYPGGPAVDVGDIVINANDVQCGNANGNVRNDKFGTGLQAATVRIYSENEATNASGLYVFDCPAQGFRLPAGSSRVRATKSNYYSFDSNGNLWYRSQPSVNIIASTTVPYDIKMWPVETGNIVVTVVDDITLAPIANTAVHLRPYTGGDPTVNTNANGQATFSNIIETWPPLNLPGGNYYSTAVRNHLIDVNPDLNVYLPNSATVSNFHAGNSLNITIRLRRQGGL